MHYSGGKDNYHGFNEINDIRTVFWVVGRSSGFMLGHKTSNNFHSNGNYIFPGNSWVPNAIHNADLFLNGNRIDGSQTKTNRNFGIMSLRTTANVKADNFSKDRDNETRVFNGELGEFELGNLKIGIYNLTTFEKDLIFITNSNNEKN